MATIVKTDVIVVGGGPAGAGAATWLQRAGWQVTLLDRARFPRDKACGEFLTPQAAHLLRDLGVWPSLEAVGIRPVAATLLCAPDGRQVRHAPQSDRPAGYALRRIALDAALLQHARACSVNVREGFAVRELRRDEQGQVIGVVGRDEAGELMELRARLIIGADGARSLVARQLALVRPVKRLQRLAVVSHWQNVPGAGDAIEMRAQGQIVCGMGFPGPNTDLTQRRKGAEREIQDSRKDAKTQRKDAERTGEREERTEQWSEEQTQSEIQNPKSKIQNCANLTFVVPTDMAAQIAGRAGEFVEETLRTCFPDLSERLAGAQRETDIRAVGCFGHVSRPAVAAGALLVGDAATFIDPFTGEGVYFALRGAQLAAEVADAALRADDLSYSRLLAYPRARRELSRRYLLCDLVQSVVRSPWLLTQAVRRLDRFPGAADLLLSVLADVRPPTDVMHPLLLWRLLAPSFSTHAASA